MAPRRELMKGNIDSLLLCLLAQGAMYGYKIIKELDQRSSGYFKFKEGTLYPALHRLEADGLIEGKWQYLPSGRQRKNYYITEKGQAVLNKEKVLWRNFLNAMTLIINPE
jgi:PadR family transcriptional regulator, regulatory protein PadR